MSLIFNNLFLVFFSFFFHPQINQDKKIEKIVIVLEDVATYNDTCTAYSNLNIYKKRGNTIYSNHKNKRNKKEVEWLWLENKECYAIFKLKNSKGIKIEEGYWDVEMWKFGYYIIYNTNGTKNTEGVYYNYEKIGKFIFYDENGIVKKIENYPDPNNIIGSSNKFPRL